MQKYDKKEKRDGKTMGIICLSLAVLCTVVIILLIVLGYFVSFVNEEHEPCDGLGRMLDEIPPALSFMPQWAGYIWFIIDCLLLLGMIIAIDKLIVRTKIYFTGIKNVDF